MKNLLLPLLLLFSCLSYAGGSSFDIEVLSFTSNDENSATLIFKVLSTPYGESLEDFTQSQENLSLNIDYECGLIFIVCFFKSDLRPSTEEHQKGLKTLSKIAKPNHKIKVGLMGGQLVAIDRTNGLYKTGGLKIHGNVVYFYKHAQ